MKRYPVPVRKLSTLALKTRLTMSRRAALAACQEGAESVLEAEKKVGFHGVDSDIRIANRSLVAELLTCQNMSLKEVRDELKRREKGRKS